MSGSRAEILGKIRRALVKPRLEHHHGHDAVSADLRELFASVGSRDGLVEKFQKEFELVSGEFSYCDSAASAVQRLTQLIQSSASDKVAISRHPICERLAIAEALRAQLSEVNFLVEDIESENSFDRMRLRNALAQVQLSITGAEYLIAESGTIVAVAGTQASRQISLLPLIHIVLATADQIYPNMADLFLDIQERYGTKLSGSALTCITGPSRTADIEKVLIKGVHGPTRLLLIMVAA
ncbi:MAG: lactate utilization protein [Acidobacteria bacterium]|nr:lactate utilization protein [Acidobacteriota bacterium]